MFSIAFMTETIEHRVARPATHRGLRRACAPSGPSASGWSATPTTAGTARQLRLSRHSTRKPTFSRTWK